MKLFLDTANYNAIKEWAELGIIDGVTTNPSHLSKESSDIKTLLRDICAIVAGDVNIEVVEKEPEALYNQAHEIASLAPNVVVKIPFSKDYLPIMKKLVLEGIRINVTLIFSLIQALLVSKLGVTYISPFIGRWDDIDVDGMQLIEELTDMKRIYGFKSQILAASIRHVMHLHHAILLGADVATIPPTLLTKVMSHPLTTQGIEIFDADWKKLNKTSLL